MLNSSVLPDVAWIISHSLLGEFCILSTTPFFFHPIHPCPVNSMHLKNWTFIYLLFFFLRQKSCMELRVVACDTAVIRCRMALALFSSFNDVSFGDCRCRGIYVCAVMWRCCSSTGLPLCSCVADWLVVHCLSTLVSVVPADDNFDEADIVD